MNTLVTEFTNKLRDIINQHTKKEILRNSKTIRQPWMTIFFHKCIHKRDTLHTETKKEENKDN